MYIPGMAMLSEPPSEPEALRTRVHAYARLMALIADQMEALDRGQMARYHELAGERDQLQRELSANSGELHKDEAVDEMAPFLHQTLQAMEARAESGELLRDRLSVLRDASLQAIRGLESRRIGGCENYLPPRFATAQVNILR